MTARIRVTVVRRKNRRNLFLRFRDRATNTELFRSSETPIQREAERAASRWEDELRADPSRSPDEMTWEFFGDKYRVEHLASLAKRTRQRAQSVMRQFAKLIQPTKLSLIDSKDMSRFASLRRTAGSAETTIQSDIGHLRAALRWAVDVGFLKKAPHFPRVHRAKTAKRQPMKGRPITDAEFETMVKAVPQVIDEPSKVPAWEFYLRGLWWSGLRLSESLDLFWDRDDALAIDLSHTRPMFRVVAESEKGNRDRFLPMAPEFAEFILKVPKRERTGRVFKLPRDRERGDRKSFWRVSEIVSKIGNAAGIVVDSRGPKYASCHDLRRSFGTRWAMRPGITPQILMKLMRHESIETTMRYYVELEAQDTSEKLYEAIGKGNQRGNRTKK